MTTPDSIQDARHELDNPDPMQRVAALTYLLRHDYPERTDDLLQSLKDRDESVVMLAGRGLSNQPGDVALAGLLTMLESASSRIKQSAALALGDHGDLRAIPHLLAALGDSDWQVRLCSIYGLARLGGPQALLAMYDSLTDRHRDVRFAAAHFLSALELRSVTHGR